MEVITTATYNARQESKYGRSSDQSEKLVRRDLAMLVGQGYQRTNSLQPLVSYSTLDRVIFAPATSVKGSDVTITMAPRTSCGNGVQVALTGVFCQAW